MKKICISLLCLYASVIAAAQQKNIANVVVFKGVTDKKYDGDKVVLYNRVTNDHDSAFVKDGRFVITVSFKEPTRYMFYSELEMKTKGGYSPFGIIVTQPGDIIIKADMENFPSSAISGSAEQDLYNRFASVNDEEQQKIMDQLTKKYGATLMNDPTPDTSDSKFKEMVKEYQALSASNEINELIRLKAFIKNNPGSFSSVYLLDMYGRNMEPAELENIYLSLPQTYKDTRNGKSIITSYQSRKMTAIGNPAPGFSQADTSGHVINLSDFRGKYVLLDFWASWCGPCRAENPHVRDVFMRYRDKGFTVLGVSLDRPGKKEAWLEAIHKDGLIWTQVSDLKFWDNEAALLYDVKAIPANLLIDPDGKIIAKNLYGAELEKKLSDLIK